MTDMTHNDMHNTNDLPLPEHAYAATDEQSEYFFDEARHLLMLAADKLTAAGFPGQEHHELEISTPNGDFARLTIDYAHEDCDIVESDIGLLARRLVNDHGYDHAIGVLEELADAIEEEAHEAAEAINEAVMSDPGEYGRELTDEEVDMLLEAIFSDEGYNPADYPEVASDTSDDRYAITPMGSEVLEQYRDEWQRQADAAVLLTNSFLVAAGEQMLTEAEEAYIRG